MKTDKNQNFRICPYLGQRVDPGTALSYSSELNRCYHVKPAVGIEFGHQEEFCLTARYSNCSEYAKEPQAALPAVHYHSREGRSRKKGWNIFWWLIFGIVGLAGLGILFVWQLLPRISIQDLEVDVPTGLSESTATSPELTSTILTSTKTPTLAPTFLDTATLGVFLGLETPLGIDKIFVIHQVQDGESLELIARQHGTTIEVLRACNYRLPVPLLTGWAIVIPLNITDTRGLPAFEVYSVIEDISIEDLALRLSVDLEDFKHYNVLTGDFMLKAGDWVLVPRSGTPTP